MTLKIYFEYFKVSAGVFGAILNFIFLISSQILITCTDFWINHWASFENINSYTEFSSLNKKLNETFLNNKTFSFMENRSYNYQIYTSKLF